MLYENLQELKLTTRRSKISDKQGHTTLLKSIDQESTIMRHPEHFSDAHTEEDEKSYRETTSVFVDQSPITSVEALFLKCAAVFVTTTPSDVGALAISVLSGELPADEVRQMALHRVPSDSQRVSIAGCNPAACAEYF